MLKFLPATLLALLHICATEAKAVVHETALSHLPSGWKYIAPANDSTQLSLSIALKQPGLEELRKRLDDISNPSHHQYGAHLSRDEVRRYSAVSEPAVDTVLSWLQDYDIADIDVNDAWVRFNATVGQINELLSCRMSSYHVTGFSNTVYRAQRYSLPEELLSTIDYISPVTQFVSKKKEERASLQSAVTKRSESRDVNARAAMPSSCTTKAGINPDCVVELYNITYTPPDALSNSSIAIVGFLEEYPGLDYIHEFLAAYSPHRTTAGYNSSYDFHTEALNGGDPTNQGQGGEANLDLACTMPYVQPLDVTYYSVGGRGPYINEVGVAAPNDTTSLNEPWIPFLEALIAKPAVPQVLSISYTDDEQSVPRAYAARVCDLFMQLTSRGVSVLVASGDGGQSGTGTSAAGGCYANDGFLNKTEFIPTFPASCPYVTSVGATAPYSTVAGADLSAGGFSNYFARPAWQESAASGYIAALDGAHEGWYNASGRGIPDIAAVGSRIQIGGGLFAKGTSASTPIVASMIALINDKRLRAGNSTLGFLNPLLYGGQLDEAILDSTEGSGGSCSFNDGSFKEGFDALPGWDPVTGLGTINFGQMMSMVSGSSVDTSCQIHS